MRNATLFSQPRIEADDVADDVRDMPEPAFETRSAAIGTLRPRARRGYGLLKGRRTRFQAKRRTGRLTAETPIHRGEREIIARN